ncbi:hypothetical protein KUTeg_003371 [Tegillarca granosa]|uniref:Arrestin C-terminal-like domain-containing protein n=1 Tax=Tegillarca granosa TaxID=220873 RepID=A0ABQ9FPU8_TEGGR|nr:hypothetical protein KUTeg_003371 [Tegillarca granosa]
MNNWSENGLLYNTKDEFGNEIKYEAKKDYVDCTDIILYQAEVLISFDDRKLCFSIQRFTKSDPPQSIHVEQEINRFIFFKKRLHLTARMSEQLQRSGEVGKMRLIITNDTGLDVASLSIRLLRDIRLISKPDKDLNPKDARLSQIDNKVYIQPEGGPFVVWENIISGCDKTVLNRGLDNICIPFRYDENVPLCSSCIGHHVQCRYCVEVVVRLVGDSIATINIPILSLLHHKDKEWYSWQPPDWKVKHSQEYQDSKL